MRDYEILYIVRPELDEEQLNEAVQKVNALIENLGGRPQRTNVWGRRRLAYEVDRLSEGYYVLTDVAIEPARGPAMESTLKISDTVFRHLVVRKPEKGSAQPPARAAETVPAATDEGAGAESEAAASVDAAPAASAVGAAEEEPRR